MTTKVVDAGSIKEGSYIVMDNAACRVVSVDIGKSGKHGHKKARIVAIGLIDEKKREIVVPAHDNVEVPIIDKKSAQVLSVVGDAANVMDSESYETFDLKIPDELKATVVPGVSVLYWNILGQKVMKQLKGGAE
ncbi:MAG: translation initiation factor IF-5A [Candidatus Aenigmarchaeota archaeon]|nr:translation initiation factor IF-5A [Candidatus Aenigmarchaeota archaeon]